MARGFEDLDVYHLAEDLSDQIWDLVSQWDSFSRNAPGTQLVRAADSVGANIAEGSGRGTYRDNCHFAKIARGSFYETRHFLRRAYRRKLLSEDQIQKLHLVVQELGPKLNGYIRMLSRRMKEKQ